MSVISAFLEAHAREPHLVLVSESVNQCYRPPSGAHECFFKMCFLLVLWPTDEDCIAALAGLLSSHTSNTRLVLPTGYVCNSSAHYFKVAQAVQKQPSISLLGGWALLYYCAASAMSPLRTSLFPDLLCSFLFACLYFPFDFTTVDHSSQISLSVKELQGGSCLIQECLPA